MAKGWHILRAEGQVTVARHLPPRFDMSASTVLADGDGLRLASQVRQDLWRALQGLRGFSPVVEVTRKDDGMHVKAGGRTITPACSAMADRISAVLENPANRARWVRCAGGLK